MADPHSKTPLTDPLHNPPPPPPPPPPPLPLPPSPSPAPVALQVRVPGDTDLITSPVPVPSPVSVSSQLISPATGRHPAYRGIRSRSGKWVSEIREPRKTTRIWLGTYLTPEMAAAAYDVAAIALKGPDTPLNFPNLILSYPIPASASPAAIRAAASIAAAAQQPRLPESGGESSQLSLPVSEELPSAVEGKISEFVDEEELLNMPNVLVDMAKGMLVSPPRLRSSSSDDSPDDSASGGLWNYS